MSEIQLSCVNIWRIVKDHEIVVWIILYIVYRKWRKSVYVYVVIRRKIWKISYQQYFPLADCIHRNLSTEISNFWIIPVGNITWFESSCESLYRVYRVVIISTMNRHFDNFFKNKKLFIKIFFDWKNSLTRVNIQLMIVYKYPFSLHI